MALAAVSVDLDEIDCYTAIHGLPDPEGPAAHAIYERTLPRLRRLFADEGVRATFFAIGRDLAGRDNEDNRTRLAELAADGHEIANHTQNHLYDLTRRDREEVRREIGDGMDAIEEATGIRPRGFRAPGYTITDGVFEVLGELGVAWDSSVFPCPGYYAAKAAAISAIRVRGRRSHSIVDDPRVLTAPADPYRIGRPYWRRGDGMVELPIGVTRDLSARLPYIGTTVVMSREAGARRLTRLMRGRPLVNLELHGIDAADAADDGLSFLAPHQPDLRRSGADKEASLRAALAQLREDGASFVTLSEAASSLGTRA